MKNKIRLVPILATLLCSPLFAQQSPAPAATPPAAGEIVIPAGSQGEQADAPAVPARGLRQPQVLAQFGEPQRRSPARGEPPITRWWYPKFVVYFEGDTVIHSVRIFQRTQ